MKPTSPVRRAPPVRAAGNTVRHHGRGSDDGRGSSDGRGADDSAASDAHTPDIREAGLATAVEALEDEGLARFLTVEAPSAIVAGEPVPDPPRKSRRRRWYILF